MLLPRRPARPLRLSPLAVFALSAKKCGGFVAGRPTESFEACFVMEVHGSPAGRRGRRKQFHSFSSSVPFITREET